MKRFIQLSFQTLLIAAITFSLAEAALRLFPGIIPPGLLYHFEPELRQEAALGRFLTYGQTVLLERDDGGPPLRLVKPRTNLHWKNPDGKGQTITNTTDENGFCNPEGRYVPRQIDVITIGDSFTWCHAVTADHTWTEGMARYTGMSAYNLGRGAVGLYEHIQILKKFGLQKKPRIVILAVYEGNDLRDAQRYHAYRREIPSLHQSDAKPSYSLLRRYSYAANILYSVRYKLRKKFRYLTKKTDDTDFRYQLLLHGQEIAFNIENTDVDEVQFAKRLQNREIDFQLFDDVVEQFVMLSVRNAFVPVVAYIPSAHTAYEKYVQFADSTLSTLMPEFSRQQRDYFQRKGQQLGFLFVDLTPRLQTAAAESSIDDLLYLRRTLHLTVRGHDVVAKELVEFIQNQDLESE